MNRLSNNELIGAVALQSALQNMPDHRLSFAKAMLVLPLLFDRVIRATLKNRRSIVLSSKDLLLSKPSAFSTLRNRFEDLTITSLNTILLTHEIGMTELNEGNVILKKEIFLKSNSDIGNTARDILDAGPKLGIILKETAVDLYQNFRIEL
jgi:hypothetical protein